MTYRPTVYPGEQTRNPGSLHLDGTNNRALETGRARLIVTGAMFVLAFSVIAIRMVDVTIVKGLSAQHARSPKVAEMAFERADVTDRNGVLLATSLPFVSLYARPREIRQPADAARRIAAIIPELNAVEVQNKLQGDRTFVYLRRNLTPRQEYAINALGIPGLHFEKGEKRVYPQGELAAHVVGLTDLDGKGIAGIEKTFEAELKSRRDPLKLSIDIRMQTVLRNELARTMGEFRAIGATGMVMDVRTGEMVAMVSLPDFNPNNLSSATPDAMFNRATLGVYEMGSTFKLFNTAAVIDNGIANVNSTFDATHPIKIAKFSITDYHAENRWISVAEILRVSSNIGSAKMAMAMGTETQRAFLTRMGLTRPASIELPEVGSPMVPNPWREINTMTISYGHGMAVTPLNMVAGVTALVNGGQFHPATLLLRNPGAPIPSQQVIKPETSRDMRNLMRMVVTEGTGGKADVPGYEVGGKTGTAEKNGAGGYRHKSLMSSFIAAFPASDPRYVVLAMIDEPQGNKESFGFATAGWTAAPAISRIIAQIGPMMGMAPSAIPEPAAKDKAPLAHDVVAKGTHADKGVAFAKAE